MPTKNNKQYDNSILFIVTSSIFCTDKPLCYTDTRSVFTPEERAKQTIVTVESIRDKFVNAKILLIDIGYKYELPFNIPSLVDKYIYVGNDISCREAADSKFKGMGEAFSLLAAKEYLAQETMPFFIKISGRYFLSDFFDFDHWNLEKYNFTKCGYNDIVSTCLYGFPKTEFEEWICALNKTIPLLKTGISIENALCRYIDKNEINVLNNIGVAGRVSVDGSFINL